MGAGFVYYLRQEGDNAQFEHLPAPRMLHIAAYKLGPSTPELYDFGGEWRYVGQHLSDRTMTAQTSWSTTTERSVTESFEWGLTQSITWEQKTGFVVAENKITIGFETSQQWGRSVTETVGRMESGSNSYSCGSESCTAGNLYQWMIRGISASGVTQTIDQCSFVCIPSTMPASVKPKCPAQYCGELQCQCCNDDWAEDGNPPESPICAIIDESLKNNACLGCD